MLKLVVFDDGWGGEVVANFLMKELKIAEIIRVIDWAESPYSDKSKENICSLAIERLASYVGHADVIILGGYTVSLALDALQARFPEQIFVGMSINYDRILRSRNSLENIVVLAERIVCESDLQLELRTKLPYSTIILPDCDGWQQKIDGGAMTKGLLSMDLATDFQIVDDHKPECKGAKSRSGWEAARTNLLEERQLNREPQKVAIRNAIARLKTASQEVAVAERAELATRLGSYSSSMVSKAEEKFFQDTRIKPNVVLLLNTHFWDIKKELEEIFGWNVRIMDFREKLLRDICRAVRLRGVDGKRSK